MKLTKMKQDEFEIVKGKMIADYTREKVKHGIWGEEEALDLSKETFETLLKDGVETENHFLYNVVDENGNNIAFVWLAKAKQECFIYNIDVYEGYKGEIDYKNLFSLLEEKVVSLGGNKLSVHTFGYNEDIINRYEEVGFEITDVTMCKKL